MVLFPAEGKSTQTHLKAVLACTQEWFAVLGSSTPSILVALSKLQMRAEQSSLSSLPLHRSHSSCDQLHLNWGEGHLNPTSPLQTPGYKYRLQRKGRSQPEHKGTRTGSTILFTWGCWDATSGCKERITRRRARWKRASIRRMEETNCWEEQQKSSAAMWVKVWGYLEQSTRWGRAVKTPGHHKHLPVPHCYLRPLSTASLSAEAARFIFKGQWATWVVTLFHEMEFSPPAFLRGLRSTCDCKALQPYTILPITTLLCAQAEQPITWTANLEKKISLGRRLCLLHFRNPNKTGKFWQKMTNPSKKVQYHHEELNLS